jgi:hypothetical protein
MRWVILLAGLLAVGCSSGNETTASDTQPAADIPAVDVQSIPETQARVPDVALETLAPAEVVDIANGDMVVDIADALAIDVSLTDSADTNADLTDAIPDLIDVAPDLVADDLTDTTLDLADPDLTDSAPDLGPEEVVEEVAAETFSEVIAEVVEEIVEPCEVTTIDSCAIHFFIEPTYPVVQDGVWITGTFTGWGQPGAGALPMSLNDKGTLWQLDVEVPANEKVEYKFLMTWPDNATPTWVTQDWEFQGNAPNSTIVAHCGETACDAATFIHGPRIQWPGPDGFWILAETDLNVPLQFEVTHGASTMTLSSTPEPPQIFWLENIGPQPPGYQHRLFVPLAPPLESEVTLTVVNGPPWQATIALPQTLTAQRLAVYGDTRTGHEAHQMVVDAVADESPDAVIVTGDFVDIGLNWGEWETWATIESKLLESVFWLPVYGNHEVFEGGKGRPYLESWFQTDNRYRSGGNYWLDLGLVGLVALDPYHANFAKAEALAWLDNALTHLADKPWLVVAFHEPYYSFMGHPPWTEGQTHLEPLFMAHGVDLVLNGHDHAFEHFLANGIHYVVAGGGGAPLSDYPGEPPPDLVDETIAYGAFYHYVLIDVTEGELTATVIQLPDNQVVDEFTLAK